MVEQIWQLLFLFLDEPEVFLQVWRVHRQVGFIILVEEFDLVIYVPCAFVARTRGQKTAPSAHSQERLYQLVSLCVRVTQVMALIYQHEVSVTVFYVCQQEICRTTVVLSQIPHREYA